ncbi:hypothetical protein L9F63_020136 [Diploptera punctata]|uniref:MYND-type domain-containing protein n=1 Tax=Diploptera punctata TaxID=6984 RepID=A0AAD8EDZ3_DIPPU|nr:hypothetical protein L9F63_020136 [Diploptera punctata]
MAENLTLEGMVELGYLEESESWRLQSVYFPSKLGGKPAWLDLYNLPEKIICQKCNKGCIFLCQVYAPIEDKDCCFHRTIFVFFCKNPECCEKNYSGNFTLFRCQLKRANEFYSFNPPIELPNLEFDVIKCTLCSVCGNKGTSCCGKCKTTFYCSKDHQIIDWKSNHKAICSKDKKNGNEIVTGVLLPQFEIVIEDEEISEDETCRETKTEKERLQEFEHLVQEGKAGTLQGDDSINDELQKMAISLEDKYFSKFTKRVSKMPKQVLRYDRGGKPLWISSDHIPNEDDIPNCEYCGKNRQFEFQILPQMLNYLDLDNTQKSVDWGVLAIYTCSESCDGGPAYKQEFLWKQDIVSTAL